MGYLKTLDVECVLYKIESSISNNLLSQTLVNWRYKYAYEIDGVIVSNDDIYDSFMKQYPNVGNFIITQMSKSPNMIPFLQEALSAFRNAMRKVQYLETVRPADTVVFLKLLRDPKN